MRVAAGVLLIIMALINLIGGVSFGFFGTVVGMAGEEFDAAVNEELDKNQDLTDEERAEAGKIAEQIKDMSPFMAPYGFLCIGLAILEVVGAVFCFANKNPMVIMIAGGVEIILSVVGIAMIGGFVMPAFGIIVGILAIVAGINMRNEGQPGAQMGQPGMAPMDQGPGGFPPPQY